MRYVIALALIAGMATQARADTLPTVDRTAVCMGNGLKIHKPDIAYPFMHVTSGVPDAILHLDGSWSINKDSLQVAATAGDTMASTIIAALAAGTIHQSLVASDSCLTAATAAMQ